MLPGRDNPPSDLLSATHRLPTVSAAQAQEDLTGDPSRFVSTGLDVLDTLLAAPGSQDGSNKSQHGGVQRGLVTEIWGPPGIGKTSLGLQLAYSALGSRRSVTWVDAFHKLCPHRLAAATSGKLDEELVAKFTHFTCPELSHLVALLCRPNALCVPPDTSLIVIDSLTALLNHAFPRTGATDAKSAANRGGNRVPSRSVRRQQTIQYVIGALQKLAATRDLAIVILSQCATKMQLDGGGAVLVPAVNAGFWDEGISTRVALFRDWAMQGGSARAARFAAVLKINGKKVDESHIELAAFEIGPTGLMAVALDDGQARKTTTPGQRRRLGDSGGAEIPDSDDEDYGWQEEDDAALPPIPQWQGSEDILLGRDKDSEDESDPDEEPRAVESEG